MSQSKIVSISLRNFQKWKKLKLDLQSVTTIVGKSDSGKSAVIRALFWVVFNKPNGKSFIRHGASYCKVTVVLSDGTRVTRKRSKKDNVYILNGDVLRSFKNDPPAPVTKALQLCRDNFLLQHDQTYWLSLSPAEISKKLNEIADLSSMDKATKIAHNKLRESKSKKKFCEEELHRSQKTLHRLQHVPAMLEGFETLKTLERKLNDTADTKARLSSLFQQLAQTTEQAKHIETALFLWRKVEDTKARKHAIEETAETIQLLIRQIDSKKKELACLQKQVEILKVSTKVPSVTCPKCKNEFQLP